MPKPITADEIKQFLSYDPVTGIFTWIVDRGSNKVKGTVAGACKEGYITIHINHQNYRAHILAWIYHYGEQPTEIDHINRVKSDNRIGNLRLTTRALNARNRSPQKRNASGVAGVHLAKTGKWRATITKDGVTQYLGEFEDIADAIAARLYSEKQTNFGEHNA
jgi:hypothetical protein